MTMTEPDTDAPAILEPKTQQELLRDLWHDMKDVKYQVRRTNGRVTKLERILIIGGAFAAGILVATGIISPASLVPWL